MKQTAIIDSTTRIIKRLTTDDNPSYDATSETPVVMSSPISLNGFTVLGLDNVTLTPATTTQIQQAGLDPTFNMQQKQIKIQNLKTAIQNLQNDSSVPTTVKQTFAAFIQAFLQ